MVEAGAHFGHQTRRWNPKMKRFIWCEGNGIYIIDLEQTLGRVETAYGYVRDLVAGGGTILFVGTKKQAQDPVRSYAEKCGMPYVNERWLGGMLTNFETMSKRVGKMLEYERMQASGEFDAMIKKEALLLDRELTLDDLREHRHLVIRDSGARRTRSGGWLNENRWTVSHKATSIRAACMGLGYAWFPEESIREELRAERLRPLRLAEGRERFATVYLMLADSDLAGPATRRLATLLRERTASHSTDSSQPTAP